MAKINKEDLLEELNESRRELKVLYNDAQSLESNISDAYDNLDRIIGMLADGSFDLEPEDPDIDINP